MLRNTGTMFSWTYPKSISRIFDRMLTSIVCSHATPGNTDLPLLDVFAMRSAHAFLL